MANRLHNLRRDILCVQLHLPGFRHGRVTALGCRRLPAGAAARAGKDSSSDNGQIQIRCEKVAQQLTGIGQQLTTSIQRVLF